MKRFLVLAFALFMAVGFCGIGCATGHGGGEAPPAAAGDMVNYKCAMAGCPKTNTAKAGDPAPSC